MLKNGVFITIEGIEGVGKSTALSYIENYLRPHIKIIKTREPGGTPMAEAIRKIVLHSKASEQELIHGETEALLMFAARSQHVQEFIRPHLQDGTWVLSDRFVDSSLAYQGGGRGLSLERLCQLRDWIVGDALPDLTLLLDAPVEIGMARVKHRALDRIEQERQEFFERVRQAYLALAVAEPKRFRIINAAQSIAAVQKQIKFCLDELLEKHHESSSKI